MLKERISKYLKYLLIAIGIFFIFLIVSSAGKKLREETPSLITPPPPNIPRYITDKLPITLNIHESDFTFPSEVSLVEITRKYLSLEYATNLADKLNFSSQMQRFSDKMEGIKYIWSEDDKTLIITPKTSTINYYLTNEIEPAEINIDPGDVENSVFESLQNIFNFEKNNLKNDLSLYYIVTPYIEVPQIVNFWDNANLYQFNISYNISDIRILTNVPSTSLITVQTLPDGEFFRIDATILDSITESKDSVPLKNFDDFKNSINDASLVEISGKYIYIRDLNVNEIVNINLEEIELVYLYNSSVITLIQPVFLLTGNITFKDNSTNPVSFYLSAVK